MPIPTKILTWLKFVLVTILLACVYGIIHDQVTIRVSPLYFTEFHAHLVDSTDLTVIAIAWGTAATWWMGAIGGAVIATFATVGRHPVAPFPRYVRESIRVLAIAMLCAFLVGILTYLTTPATTMSHRYAHDPESARRFTAVLATHDASYLSESSPSPGWPGNAKSGDPPDSGY